MSFIGKFIWPPVQQSKITLSNCYFANNESQSYIDEFTAKTQFHKLEVPEITNIANQFH